MVPLAKVSDIIGYHVATSFLKRNGMIPYFAPKNNKMRFEFCQAALAFCKKAVFSRRILSKNGLSDSDRHPARYFTQRRTEHAIFSVLPAIHKHGTAVFPAVP